MLQRLELTNFRRHEHSIIEFSDDAQIVAITGRNGAGKSTILEALLFGLYGESRHGRRGLPKLVRRGAEHEGMQVELRFTSAGVTYDLIRRHEKGVPSARLLANGTAIAQRADGVTAEVEKILGMDSVAFKLAVIAQQFDVDGLAELKPTERKRTVTRLLRQDTVTRAAKNARDIYTRELAIIKAMGDGPDMDVLHQELADNQKLLIEAQAAAADSRQALLDFDMQLLATSDVETAWQKGQIELARAEERVRSVEEEIARLTRELHSVHVPEAVPAPARSLAEIDAAISTVNIAISSGEEARKTADLVASTRSDLDKVVSRLGELGTLLNGDTPASVAMQTTTLATAITATESEIAKADTARTDLLSEYAGLDAQLKEIGRRESQAHALGDVCDMCEQSIPAEHKNSQEAQRQARKSELAGQRTTVLASGEQVKQQLADLTAKLAGQRRERDALVQRRAVVTSALSEQQDLERRRTQYAARLDRIVVEEVDLEALYAQKAHLEIEKADAKGAEEILRVREAALERQTRTELSIVEAGSRLEDGQAAMAAAAPPADLVAAREARSQVAEQRAQEADMLGELDQQVVAFTERVKSTERAIESAQAQVAKGREHRDNAEKAALAARLLTETAETMATMVRPALEGEISTLLQQLSEGRFTKVQVSDDFEITVEDDGKFEKLSEFSGGERNLIALATRLALANVIPRRTDGDSVGFLILDEVFGSQDDERREAIMGALRGLRGLYGQILLISHVGGFDEAADRVVHVNTEEVDGMRVAEVVAS